MAQHNPKCVHYLVLTFFNHLNIFLLQHHIHHQLNSHLVSNGSLYNQGFAIKHVCWFLPPLSISACTWLLPREPEVRELPSLGATPTDWALRIFTQGGRALSCTLSMMSFLVGPLCLRGPSPYLPGLCLGFRLEDPGCTGVGGQVNQGHGVFPLPSMVGRPQSSQVEVAIGGPGTWLPGRSRGPYRAAAPADRRPGMGFPRAAARRARRSGHT